MGDIGGRRRRHSRAFSRWGKLDVLLRLLDNKRATHEPVACLLGLGLEERHCRLDPLVRLVHLAAAVAAGGIADRTHSPVEEPPAVAAAAALIVHSCCHNPVAGRGPSHRPGCSMRRPIVRTDHAGRSRNRHTAGHIARRSLRAAFPGAKHLGRSAAVARAVDIRRTAAGVAAAVGRPLVRMRDVRQK